MESFVDKVYDKYLKNDFSVGVDNLNPKREITLSTKIDVDEEIRKVHALIKENIENTKRELSNFGKAPILEKDREVVSQGNTAAGRSQGKTANELLNQYFAGTILSDDPIYIIPGIPIEDENDILTNEVEKLIFEISAVLEILDPQTSPPEIEDIVCIDCTDASDPISKNDGKVDDGKVDDGKVDDDNEEDDNQEESGGLPSPVDPNGLIDDSDLLDELNDRLDNMRKFIDENNLDRLFCLKRELGILKVVLCVVKIVKLMLTLVQLMYPIVMFAMEIIALIAQCWINPPSAATALTKIASHVLSILLGIASELLQMLWDMLGLDCLTSSAKKIINEIRAALSGVTDIATECASTAVSFGLGVKGKADEIADIIKEAKENNGWEGYWEKEGEVWKNFGQEAWGEIKDYGTKIANSFKGIVSEFWDKESGGGEINKLISQVNSDFKKVGEIFDKLEVK
jgi:hypothetical protein